MKKLQSPWFPGLLAIVLTLAVLAGSVRAVYAGDGAVTWKNVVSTFNAFGTCSDPDGLYQITVVSSGTLHYVENENGYKFSVSESGTYYLEPIEADSSVTYSGRYTDHFQDRLSKGVSMIKHTFTNVGTGSDGSHEVFHITFRLVVTPSGLVRQVDNVQWICN